MKTYFVTSDIHGFFLPFRKGLEDAGFDKENPDHYLIVLGDILDRGKDGKEVYSFLRKFPKQRRILVRGNHEWLLGELLRRGYAIPRDLHNQTSDTLIQFAYGIKRLEKRILDINYDQLISEEERIKKTKSLYAIETRRLFKGRAIWEVLKWFEGKEWVDYYETNHYVFVHAWVPTLLENGSALYDPNWRNAPKEAWTKAIWDCPYKQYINGLWDKELLKGKTLVCGHWYTGDFYNNLDYSKQPEKQLDCRVTNPIYRSKAFPGLIGLDALTAVTGKINVLVLKEDEL